VVSDRWVRLTAIVAAAAVLVLAFVPDPLLHLAATAFMRLQ
jgi:hypothetical protein